MIKDVTRRIVPLTVSDIHSRSANDPRLLQGIMKKTYRVTVCRTPSEQFTLLLPFYKGSYDYYEIFQKRATSSKLQVVMFLENYKLRITV